MCKWRQHSVVLDRQFTTHNTVSTTEHCFYTHLESNTVRDRQTGIKATSFNSSTSDPLGTPPINVEDHNQLTNGGQQLKSSTETAQLNQG